MPRTPDEIAEGERRATELFARGDHDRVGTTTVCLPRPIVEQLLAARGWRCGARGWVSESGTQRWDADEALQVALVAEGDTEPILDALRAAAAADRALRC